MERKNTRWKIWPVIFLACALVLLWAMFKLAANVLMMAAILGGVLLLAGIAQRVSYHIRHGRPRLNR
ncbi:MAG: hypothetical protein M3R04_02500 [bacterium]|nr:hypothetical protein [bacterium]